MAGTRLGSRNAGASDAGPSPTTRRASRSRTYAATWAALALIRLFALASPQIASCVCADFFFCECARIFSAFFSRWASGAKPALSSRSRLSLADAAPGGAWILSSSSRSTFIACVFLYLHLFLPACSLPFSDPGPTEVDAVFQEIPPTIACPALPRAGDDRVFLLAARS